MNPLVFAAIIGAGGLGSVARFYLDGVIKTRFAPRYPIGTMVINVTGSFALGLLTGMALGAIVTDEWRLILGTGFLGGYTTFSTASFETVRLLQERRWIGSLVNGLGMVIIGVAAAALGLWLGSLV
jgi:CrcB protein